VAGIGTHEITYSFTDINGCSNTSSSTINVTPLPQISFNLITEFCINDNALPLSATPAGGVFTANGTNLNSFNPAVFGVGQHTLNYLITDVNGCSNNANLVMNVFDLPTVIFNINDNLCLNAPFYEFTDVILNPQPGTTQFTGPGVQNNGILAANAGEGLHEISLLYTDVNGCQNTADAQVLIYGLPEIELSNNQEQYCISDSITNFLFEPVGGFL
jgi:hypothetical protein